ncbi:MAG: heparinase II/III family protein [Planctomycetales bacterium]
MQRARPVGQAYLLTGNERWAKVAKKVLSQWMQENPCGYGVNWACTMEVAMRIFTWTWLFHAFHASPIWDDPDFRGDFLSMLYQHGRYTDQYLEYSDINGNHCTADAAGLVWCGLFFGQGRAAQRWAKQGWRLLEDELPKQVTRDGVDFEASVPYHRLVAELFFLAGQYQEQAGGTVSANYRARVLEMGRFIQAYSDQAGDLRSEGDADDGRTLPLEFATSDGSPLPGRADGCTFGTMRN